MQRGGILERRNVVVARQHFGQRLLQLVEILERLLDVAAALPALDDHRVLDLLFDLRLTRQQHLFSLVRCRFAGLLLNRMRL